MKKKKNRNKPKSRKNLRKTKERIARTIRKNRKKHKAAESFSDFWDDSDPVGVIKRTPLGLKTYNSWDPRFNGVHGYSFTLRDFEWLGLLTLKFHSHSHSKDDYSGDGRRNRFNFLAEFMGNIRRKFGISDREFNWFASEEFGFFGNGHLHVIFSFDYLKEKNRMDRVKISDFSEKGHFFQEGRESVYFISRKLGLNPQSVHFHWSPMWKNSGLVDYFCKNEFRKNEKFFDFSGYWKKRGLQKAA